MFLGGGFSGGNGGFGGGNGGFGGGSGIGGGFVGFAAPGPILAASPCGGSPCGPHGGPRVIVKNVAVGVPQPYPVVRHVPYPVVKHQYVSQPIPVQVVKKVVSKGKIHLMIIIGLILYLYILGCCSSTICSACRISMRRLWWMWIRIRFGLRWRFGRYHLERRTNFRWFNWRWILWWLNWRWIFWWRFNWMWIQWGRIWISWGRCRWIQEVNNQLLKLQRYLIATPIIIQHHISTVNQSPITP